MQQSCCENTTKKVEKVLDNAPVHMYYRQYSKFAMTFDD
jgi:hypothetical protein